MNVPRYDCSVDAARNEDDWECDSKCDFDEGITGCTEQCWRLNAGPNETVDKGACADVDYDLDENDCPYGFGDVLWASHFRVEGELRDAERVREDDVGNG